MKKFAIAGIAALAIAGSTAVYAQRTVRGFTSTCSTCE